MIGIAGNPILTEDQKSLLFRFRESQLRDRFYVTGGTALSAFYLQHRLSEDLDFFTEQTVGIEEVLMALTDRRDAEDYVDLYFLVKKYPELDIERAIEDVESKCVSHWIWRR